MRQLVHLKVLINGSKIPFKKMADVSVMNTGALSITPYDPSVISFLLSSNVIVALILIVNRSVDLWSYLQYPQCT